MKKYGVLLAVLCLSLIQVSSLNGSSKQAQTVIAAAVYAQADTNQTTTNQTLTHALVFNHPCFKPTNIIISFPYTHDHDITQITTIGASMYRTEGGPTSLTFNALDVDVYTFRVTLRYDNSTDRTIGISLWSGSLSMEGYTWSQASQIFIIDFRIEVKEEPHYPTKDEVAAEVFLKNAQLLVNLTQKYEAIMRDIQSANFTNSLMNAVTVSAVIVAILLIGFNVKQRKTFEGRGNVDG